MKSIGGNITAELQLYTSASNAIGEAVKTWGTVRSLNGWLDLSDGNAKYNVYNTKIQEATHVFISDYTAIGSHISAENCRLLINSKVYDVVFIDNPMELNRQLEFYLKYTGGQ